MGTAPRAFRSTGPADTVRHLYVHLPFCRSRCAYCDFASEVLGPHLRSGRVAAYLGRLEQELEDRGRLLAPRLSTAYLGGGTPTALPAADLLALVRRVAMDLAPGGELTVEANPGCLDRALLEGLLEAGATRLSLGVQSFSAELRKALGRQVAQSEVEGALRALRETGWREWSLDLVFGMPGQDTAGLRRDLEAALAAGPTHLSLYDLCYTPLYDAFLRRKLGPAARPQAQTFAEEAYGQAVAFLEAAGYRRYEVSNFALPGHESRHNLGYWRGEDYLGVGAAAVSTVGGERRTNPATVEAYLEGARPELEALSPGVRRFERVMLGLRTREGVPEAEARPVLDPQAWRRAVASGLAGSRCGTLFLNQRGLDVSNALLAEVLVVQDGRASLAEV